MKRIQKLIVGEAYVLADRPALGGVAALNWVAGKIQIFKEDYTVYDSIGADTAYDGKIAIGRFDAENNIYLSEFLTKGTIKSVVNQAYQAPVLQRTDVVLTAIGASPVGEIIGVRLVNTSNRDVIYTGRKVYEVASVGTLVTDIDAVVLAINNDTNNDATAVRSGNELRISAGAFDSDEHLSEPHISATTIGGWSSAAFSTVVAAVSGIGTSEKVSLIEQLEDWGTQGVMNRREFPVLPTSYVTPASTYNLLTIETGTPWGGTNGVSVGDVAPKALIIAMQDGGTGDAAFLTSLLVWLNVKIDDIED